MIYLKVKNKYFEIGSVDFFKSFFETIFIRLENSIWGSEYPVLMNEFYTGNVSKDTVQLLKIELNKVHDNLKKHSPDEIVWDSDNLNIKPPWGDNISHDITDLGNYFVTSNGVQLFDIINEAINFADENKEDIQIVKG